MRAVDCTQRLGALGVPELEQRAAAGEQAAGAVVIERVHHVLHAVAQTFSILFCRAVQPVGAALIWANDQIIVGIKIEIIAFNLRH